MLNFTDHLLMDKKLLVWLWIMLMFYFKLFLFSEIPKGPPHTVKSNLLLSEAGKLFLTFINTPGDILEQ